MYLSDEDVSEGESVSSFRNLSLHESSEKAKKRAVVREQFRQVMHESNVYNKEALDAYMEEIMPLKKNKTSEKGT